MSVALIGDTAGSGVVRLRIPHVPARRWRTSPRPTAATDA